MNFETPIGLQEVFKSVVMAPKESFPTGLTEFVSNESKKYKCIFSAVNTGNGRRIQNYICCFGGRIRSAKGPKASHNCPAYVNFMIDGDYVSYINSNFTHNHEVSDEFTVSRKCCLTVDELEPINYFTEMGLSPGNIRSKLHLSIPSQIFYNIRRLKIKEMKKDEIAMLKSTLKKYTHWHVIYKYSEEDGRLTSLSMIHTKIVQTEYAHDIVVIDDTSCINKYGLNGEVMACMDEEGNTQILAFGVLPELNTEGFKSFFDDFHSYTKQSIRLFICDRSIAQIAAVKAVYPESSYIYCRLHIARNIDQNLESNSDVGKKLKNYIHFESGEQEFNTYMEENRGKIEKMGYIEDLLKEKDHFVYSKTKLLCPFSNITSNRAEGFFGELKNFMDHQLKSLKQICEAVITISDKYVINKYRNRYASNRNYQETLISKEDASTIGIK